MSRTLGGMEILGEISAGGMGEVLLAKRSGAHGFEKLLAIKTIRPELAEREDIRALFHDEARLVARIEHPYVAQVHDFGEDSGTLFLAMEFVQGVSLDALIEKVGPLPPGIALRIAERICRGLHAAHELRAPDGAPLGVVHRDVSPPNVMLGFEGGVKIIDFGIALMRNRRAEPTQVGRIRGKILYMAPEQIAGGAIDRRTDVWGVTNVLFELLTSTSLRKGQELHEIAEHVGKIPPLVSSVIPAVEAIDALVAKGLAPDPADRFPDTRAMANALEAVLKEIGGDSLEEFAASHLTEEREETRLRVGGLLGSTEPKKSRGPTLVASGSTPPPVIAPPPAKPRPTLIALVLSGLFIGALAAWALTRAEPPSSTPPNRDPPAQPEVLPPPRPVANIEEPRPRTRRPVRPAPIVDRAPIGRGQLTVGAHPFAIVLIDGKERGLTPLLKLEIEEGPHRITLLDPASRDTRVERMVDVEPGEHHRVTFP